VDQSVTGIKRYTNNEMKHYRHLSHKKLTNDICCSLCRN